MGLAKCLPLWRDKNGIYACVAKMHFFEAIFFYFFFFKIGNKKLAQLTLLVKFIWTLRQCFLFHFISDILITAIKYDLYINKWTWSINIYYLHYLCIVLLYINPIWSQFFFFFLSKISENRMDPISPNHSKQFKCVRIEFNVFHIDYFVVAIQSIGSI